MLGNWIMSNMKLPNFEIHGAVSYPLDDLDNKLGRGYHSYEVIAAPNSKGEVFMVLVGKIGAMKHLLSSSFEELTSGHHSLDVENARIIGKTGAVQEDLGNWPPELME